MHGIKAMVLLSSPSNSVQRVLSYWGLSLQISYMPQLKKNALFEEY